MNNGAANLTDDPRSHRELAFSALSTMLAAASTLTSVAFIAVAVKGIKAKGRRLSPKLYLFLINRAVADLILCVAHLIMHLSYRLPVGTVLFVVAKYMSDKVFLISFYTATATLCALSILKFISISKPLVYKRQVTIFKCSLLLVAIWLLILSIVAILVIVFEIHQCRSGPTKECFRLLIYIKTFLAFMLSAFYFTNIGCYFMVTSMLAWREKGHRLSRQTSGKRKAAFINIWLNFLNFTLCYMPYLLYSIFEAIVFVLEGREQLIITAEGLGWARFIMHFFTYVRIIVDNVIPLKTDRSFLNVAMCRAPRNMAERWSTRNMSALSADFRLIDESLRRNYESVLLSENGGGHHQLRCPSRVVASGTRLDYGVGRRHRRGVYADCRSVSVCSAAGAPYDPRQPSVHSRRFTLTPSPSSIDRQQRRLTDTTVVDHSLLSVATTAAASPRHLLVVAGGSAAAQRRQQRTDYTATITTTVPDGGEYFDGGIRRLSWSPTAVRGGSPTSSTTSSVRSTTLRPARPPLCTYPEYSKEQEAEQE